SVWLRRVGRAFFLLVLGLGAGTALADKGGGGNGNSGDDQFSSDSPPCDSGEADDHNKHCNGGDPGGQHEQSPSSSQPASDQSPAPDQSEPPAQESPDP